MSKPRPSPWGRVRPTDITQAAVLVAQTSQWPVLYALRTESIETPTSPLAEKPMLEVATKDVDMLVAGMPFYLCMLLTPQFEA